MYAGPFDIIITANSCEGKISVSSLDSIYQKVVTTLTPALAG